MSGTDTRAAVLGRVRDYLTNRPRTLQTTIGPSQLGIPCTHCLAARLARWRSIETRGNWLAAVGTAVHVMLADAFTGNLDYLVETQVNVGWAGSTEVWGTSDLYSLPSATVIDWKVVGPDTLRRARSGPSTTYRAQVHLYGLGFTRTGRDVRRVAIAYLPRGAVSLDSAVWWEDDYDPTVAANALSRADLIARNLEQLDAISTAARDLYIRNLPRERHCYDCDRFADAPAI